LVGSVLLLKAYEENNWNDDTDGSEEEGQSIRTRKKQGYVAPVLRSSSSEEEE
jgi:hypothetical protein